MRYLYVLLVLSLAALLWAAMAIARHIKRHDSQLTALDAESTAPNESEVSIAAGRSGTSGSAKTLRAGDIRSDDL